MLEWMQTPVGAALAVAMLTPALVAVYDRMLLADLKETPPLGTAAAAAALGGGSRRTPPPPPGPKPKPVPAWAVAMFAALLAAAGIAALVRVRGGGSHARDGAPSSPAALFDSFDARPVFV